MTPTRAHFVTIYVDPLLYVLATVSVVITLRSVMLPVEIQHTDFVYFWDSVRWNASGHDLYSTPSRYSAKSFNLASPALLVLVVPLTALPLTVARAVWMLISVVLFAISAHQVARAMDGSTGRILSLLLISQATFNAILGGNFAAPITFCVTRAWLDHRDRRDVAAGLWIGIAMACKPFLLPFAGYAVVQRRWRMCMGILYGVALVITLGVAIFGLANTSLWIRTLREVQPETIAYTLNGSWMGWLARASTDWTVVRVCWLAGSGIIAGLLLWQWFRSDDAAWIGTIAGSLLASPLAWSYYAPLLIGPFAGSRSALLWVGYGLFCLPAEPLALAGSSTAWMLTVGSAPFWGYLVLFVASLFAATKGTAMSNQHQHRRIQGPLTIESDAPRSRISST